MNALRIFIGWDRREAVAWHVLAHSILRRASVPVEIVPVRLATLQAAGLYRRPIESRGRQLWDPVSDAPMATEFALTRFLIPRLAGWRGWAAFFDCDMLCLADIAELFALADDRFALRCVQHEQDLAPGPLADIKMDGQVQTAYPRKNWSSAVLWNCGHTAHAALTDAVLNSWSGRDLHRFGWLDDALIGDLPLGWNWLVGAAPPPEPIRMLHYTLGGPWLAQCRDVPLAGLWRAEFADMTGGLTARGEAA